MKVDWRENGIVLTGIAVAAVASLLAAEELITRRTLSPVVVTVDTPADADDEAPDGEAAAVVPLYGSQDELAARARELLAEPQPGPDLLHELARQARSFRAFTLADELLARCLELAPDRTESLFLRARTQSDLGNRERAIATYEDVLKRAPNHQKATYNLGVVLRRTGDFARAEQQLVRAAAISSGRVKAKALHQLGLVHAAGESWDRAVQFLQESVNLRPDAERVWLDLGEAEWRRGRLDAAHAAIEKSLALNGRFADAHLAMGRLEEARGNRAAAGTHLARAVRLDGESMSNRMALARHLLAEGDGVKARAAFDWIARSAVEEADRAFAQAMLALLDRDGERMLREVRRADGLRRGEYDDAIVQAATALHGQRRYADAQALLAVALAHERPSPDVLLAAARTVSRLGRQREAETLLRRSLQARPQSSEAWFQLGRLLSERGDIPGAIRAYRASLERNPGARNTQLNLAVMYARGGNEREALALYAAILQAHPRYAPALLNRARLHERAGRDADAVADLEAALDLAPADDGIRDRLARVLLRTGDPDRARELLADAVAEKPGDADTRLLLAETELLAGHRADALRELNRAAALAGDDARLWARLSQGYRSAGDAKAAARADARAQTRSEPAGSPGTNP